MPLTETLERFIARVEENAHAEAIEEFYTRDASMQETSHRHVLGGMFSFKMSAAYYQKRCQLNHNVFGLTL